MKENKKKSFDLKYLVDNWESFREDNLRKIQDTPKRISKPSKNRAKKSLDKALERCEEVLNNTKDETERQQAATEFAVSNNKMAKKFQKRVDDHELNKEILNEALNSCSKDLQEEDNDKIYVENMANMLQKAVPEAIMEALLIKNNHEKNNLNNDNGDIEAHENKKIDNELIELLKKCNAEIDSVKSKTKKKKIISYYAAIVQKYSPRELLFYLQNTQEQTEDKMEIDIKNNNEEEEIENENKSDDDTYEEHADVAHI